MEAPSLLSQSRRTQADTQRSSVHEHAVLFMVQSEHRRDSNDLHGARSLEVISITFLKEANSLKGEQN